MLPGELSELGVVRVASPCGRDWAQLTGGARARVCGDCQLTVYNLSAMTTDQAREVIRGREGRLCVRFFQRADGRVLTRDCPVGVSKRRARLVVAGATAVSLALATLADALTTTYRPRPALPRAPRVTSGPRPPVGKGVKDESWIELRRALLEPRPWPRETMGRTHPVIELIK